MFRLLRRILPATLALASAWGLIPPAQANELIRPAGAIGQPWAGVAKPGQVKVNSAVNGTELIKVTVPEGVVNAQPEYAMLNLSVTAQNPAYAILDIWVSIRYNDVLTGSHQTLSGYWYNPTPKPGVVTARLGIAIHDLPADGSWVVDAVGITDGTGQSSYFTYMPDGSNIWTSITGTRRSQPAQVTSGGSNLTPKVSLSDRPAGISIVNGPLVNARFNTLAGAVGATWLEATFCTETGQCFMLYGRSGRDYRFAGPITTRAFLTQVDTQPGLYRIWRVNTCNQLQVCSLVGGVPGSFSPSLDALLDQPYINVMP